MRTIKVKKERKLLFLSLKFNFRTIIVLTLIFTIFGTNSAFAQTSYTINIPTGAADPNAPYFWQSEKDGDATGEIHVIPRDTVKWSNADTAFHTVTSGISPDLGGEGPNGIFDSGFFSVGESWSFRFTDEGTYPYFCTIHPWMTGLVVVEAGYSVIQNVGADAGDGSTAFDVEYEFNRVIGDSLVDESQKSLTLTLVGKPQNDNNELTLFLPKNLIDDPYIIWADGLQITDFERISKGGMNTVEISLTETTEQVTIVGSSVVPEFGAFTAIILATSMVAVIFATSKLKIISKI